MFESYKYNWRYTNVITRKKRIYKQDLWGTKPICGSKTDQWMHFSPMNSYFEQPLYGQFSVLWVCSLSNCRTFDLRVVLWWFSFPFYSSCSTQHCRSWVWNLKYSKTLTLRRSNDALRRSDDALHFSHSFSHICKFALPPVEWRTNFNLMWFCDNYMLLLFLMFQATRTLKIFWYSKHMKKRGFSS